MKDHYGFCMHLSKEDNKKLLPIIKKLSNKYDKGDLFLPHISVNGSRLIDYNVAKEIANECIKGISRFKVEKESIQYSNQWSKTLFIQLKENHNLIEINKRLNKLLRQGKPPYQLNPHISLMYRSGLDSKIKYTLAKTINTPGTFTVSSIALVTGSSVGNWKNYSNWKIVYERALM
jgi:2'-5' RNA ligase